MLRFAYLAMLGFIVFFVGMLESILTDAPVLMRLGFWVCFGSLGAIALAGIITNGSFDWNRTDD